MQLVQGDEPSGAAEFAGVVHRDVTGVTVSLCGELDLASAPGADELLRQAADGAATVTLDLGGLLFMDCAGLKIVIAGDTRLRDTGGRLMIVAVPAQVRRVFELTGTTDRLELVAEPRHALVAIPGDRGAHAIAEREVADARWRGAETDLRPSAA